MSDPVTRRYTFKLYPTKAQAGALERCRAMHSALRNAALEQWNDAYHRPDAYARAGISQSAYGQSKDIKNVRAEMPEYAALNAASLALTVKKVEQAWQSYFRQLKEWRACRTVNGRVTELPPGPPRFRRTGGFSFRDGSGWKLDMAPGAGAGRVYLQGIPGKVKIRGRFPCPPLEVRTADVRLEAGVWWVSIAVRLPGRMRAEAARSGEVTFDLIDSFARVSCADGGCAAGPGETVYAAADGRIYPMFAEGSGEALGAEGDRRRKVSASSTSRAEALGTEGDRRDDEGHLAEAFETDKLRGIQQRMARCKRGSNRYGRLRQAKARAEAGAARRRRECLHVWTTGLARRFASLAIAVPPLRQVTASGRGSERAHGAAVEVKAEINRRILGMAPGIAIGMLQYKLAERGGTASVTEAPDPPAAVGNDIVAATKGVRKARRAIKRRGGAAP